MKFSGSDYSHELDYKRLNHQIWRIRDLMIDGAWRALFEIESLTGYPQASISAQLRNLRKKHGGGYIVNKRRRIERKGLWEYQLQPPSVKREEQELLFGT